MLYFESQDPLNLRHNENVRKAEERRNQDDKDVSIEVGERQVLKATTGLPRLRE